jgi:uncharacterized membrane protein HdeD (DUF308 family)
MSAAFAVNRAPLEAPPTRDVSRRRIAVGRAVLALVWAAALLIAVGDRVPSTSSDVPIAAAVLLASYPAIDVVSSIVGARRTGAAARVLFVNAAIGVLAIGALAATAFGADAGATLAAFGAWAALSGAIQFALAVGVRRAEGRQLPMLISGAISTLAGLAFLASSGSDDARLAGISGYMALGAVFFLMSLRSQRRLVEQAARS